jgi:NAD(P)-dependent dehydrogenase (short-subunit alcohol dehydrogenase family)
MFFGLYIRQVNRDERKPLMLLENKNAIVYSAGGAIGGAVARAFAHEGARVFLAARSPGPAAWSPTAPRA